MSGALELVLFCDSNLLGFKRLSYSPSNSVFLTLMSPDNRLLLPFDVKQEISKHFEERFALLLTIKHLLSSPVDI
jgi:hypothetical protein